MVAVVEEVLFSPDQTGKTPAEAMAAGSVLVVMSSIPVETCQSQAPRLAARGVGYIDAPVSGGEPGARDGTLAIMAGGDAEVVDGIADVFAAMGRVTHIGPVGTGQMTKLANQIIVGATMVAVAEALHFAASGGADPAAVRKALMGGFANSKILNIHGERMVERNFVPGGPAEYQLKDLRTAQALAAASGMHFTLLDCLVGMFGDMIDRFGTGLDVAGILQEVERRSGGVPAGKVSAKDRHDRPRHAQRRRRHRADIARPCRQDECDHAGNDAGIAKRLPRGRCRPRYSRGDDQRRRRARLLGRQRSQYAGRPVGRHGVPRPHRIRGVGARYQEAGDRRVEGLGAGRRHGDRDRSRYPYLRTQCKDRRSGSDARLARRRRRVADAAAAWSASDRRCGCLLTGDPVDAETALRLGLVEEVVDDAEVTARVMEMAKKIASFSPTATQAIKAAVRAAMSTPLEAGLRYENELHVICMSDKGRLEGIKAFQEKRDAKF